MELPAHLSPSKLRVLQVVEPGRDGVFRHVEGLCGYLLGKNVDIALAYSDVRSSDSLGELVKQVEAAGGPTVNLRTGNAPSLGDFHSFRQLQQICRLHKPDVVHAHSSKAGALTRLMKLAGMKVPVIYTPNAYVGMGLGSKSVSARFYNLIERVLAPLGHTINVSHGEAVFAFDKLRVKPKGQSTIFNAVDFRRFRPADHAAISRTRETFGIPRDAIVLGCVARASYQKNLEMLYEAVGLAKLKNANLWLFHVGEGDMTELANKFGLEGTLRRVSYLADTAPFFDAIDAFAMSSRYEGLSFAVLEALSSNLPLILTDVHGNREFLHLGLSHVWSAPGGDIKAFAAAIESWTVDRALKREINNRAAGEKLFSFDACYGKILDIYRRLSQKPLKPLTT